MDADDLDMFRGSLRHAVQSCRGRAATDLDAALDELGWAEALVDEPRPSIELFFEAQGAEVGRSHSLQRVVLAAGAFAPVTSDQPLSSGQPVSSDQSIASEQPISSEQAAALVLPSPGAALQPGRVVGTTVRVEGIATAALRDHAAAVVPAGDGLLTVPLDHLEVHSVVGLDPSLDLVTVRGRVELAEVDVAGTTDARLGGPGVFDWDHAVSRARVALAHELVGVARAMLDQARTHALDRVQFGRPIGQFQAVRHRLAETLVAIDAAAATLDAAWLEPSPVAASIAKASAGRAARTTARHCQQVLAGIGFTTEHPFHLYLRRALVLEELFGSERSLTRTLGEQVLATGQLPPMLPL